MGYEDYKTVLYRQRPSATARDFQRMAELHLQPDG